MHTQKSESFRVSALLAVSGGFLDAYTYLCRGEVFANAQTGNLVLLAMHLALREWVQAAHYLVPVLAFCLGVLVTEIVKNARRERAGWFHWRHLILGGEMAVLAAASLIPRGEADTVVNVMVSFVCALQVEAFRKVRGNPFASTMCTGNLRSGTEALYHGLWGSDPQLRHKALCYYGIIGCFLVGAALGGVVSPHFPQSAPLLAMVIQGAAFLLMCEQENQAA